VSAWRIRQMCRGDSATTFRSTGVWRVARTVKLPRLCLFSIQRAVFDKGAAALLAALMSLAQPAVCLAQNGPVTGVGEFPHGVTDVAATVEYYQRVLGFKLVATAPRVTNGKWEPNFYDKELQALMNVGGAYYRLATLRVPNGRLQVQLVEMINNQGIVGLRGARRAGAHPIERGGLALRLPVTDIRQLTHDVEAVEGTDVLTLRDKSSVGSVERALTVRDDDGFIVEAFQPAKQPGGPGSHPVEAGIVLTAANPSETVSFYRDILGFDLATGEWEDDAAAMAALGIKGSRIRRSVGVVPGTVVPFEIAEYDGVAPRRFFPIAVGQSGVGWLRLFVRDLDALMRTFTEKRVLIVSTGLQPVTFSDSRRVVIRDPEGAFVELIEPRASEASSSGETK